MVALTPGGRLLDDALVDELAAEPALTLLAGRYEGFDQRALDHFVTEEISIGRYVLAGGELAAMVLCDAVLRKLPGALGPRGLGGRGVVQPALEGAPEYPHYTRPASWRGWERSGGPAVRPPRPDPGVAPRAEPAAGLRDTTRYHDPPRGSGPLQHALRRPAEHPGSAGRPTLP